jgi:cellulose synthase/poly-beta-1,6-N-acetylglucosamine synthase-like glycosyltransferase
VDVLLERLFLFSSFMILLGNMGYPLLLAVSLPFVRRHRTIIDAEPSVSLIISAHNEEKCIARKIENSLGLDYPRERLEIIVASDGSTDRTDEIVNSFGLHGVMLCRYPRIGKTGIQNETVKIATGEILVFSDANALYQPDAIRKLVRNFSDSEVGCVSGQLKYTVDEPGAGRCEESYWSYEKYLKRCESQLSSLVGVNGSIYAVRRSDYVEIDRALISDFVEPLVLVRHGKRVVYDQEAISLETASSAYSVEFRRKVRIITRSIQGLIYMRTLLNPIRYGIFALQLLLHKLLRYILPLFLFTALVSLGGLAIVGKYSLLFFALVGVITISTTISLRKPQSESSNLVRVCNLLYYYLLINIAVALAWINVVRSKRMTFWDPVREKVA